MLNNIRTGAILVASIALVAELATAQTASSILDQSRATYAALTSYSDTGEVRVESGASATQVVVQKHRFKSSYRAPRNFHFDFVKDNGERMAVWCDGGNFQSWWSATRVHTNYPQGQGFVAFATSSYPTKGSILQISPLLFAKGGLQGPLTALAEPRLEGTETLDGRRVHKLVADVGLGYAKTGAITNRRRTTVWIDVETHLVRQVAEDTPGNYPQGAVERVITTFNPQANPTLVDALFLFEVPEAP